MMLASRFLRTETLSTVSVDGNEADSSKKWKNSKLDQFVLQESLVSRVKNHRRTENPQSAHRSKSLPAALQSLSPARYWVNPTEDQQTRRNVSWLAS